MAVCDEQPPTCGGCAKRGLQCDYQELVPAKKEANPSSSSSSASFFSSSSSPSGLSLVKAASDEKGVIFEFHPLTRLVGGGVGGTSGQAHDKLTPYYTPHTNIPIRTSPSSSLSPYVNLTDQDLFLLHHYRTTACHTLFHHGDHRKGQIWQHLVPELARIYPFVMHNILSLAAMHLATVQPHMLQEYTLLAAKHQSHVIKAAQARVASQQVNRENCSAVVICSSLLLIYELAILHPSYFVSTRASASPSSTASSSSFSSSFSSASSSSVSSSSSSSSSSLPVDEIVQKMLVMRRLVGLWNISMPLFSQGPARSLLCTGKPDLTSPLAVEVRLSLDRVLAASNTHVTDRQQRNAYRAAADSLWLCFEYCVLSAPPDWFRGLAWPNMVSTRFMAALVEREPLALVLVAHYCALLFLHPGGWWMHGWPQPLLTSLVGAVVADESDPISPTKDLFAWPAKVIGLTI
ncbi:hypothetical protein MGYG_07243 [Nannizzia gypsea CBS 118893]|uniref:Zn(2)-C6 fungal-type domain-containing protein n=1 Tax=Arthroderma gypseum (strain ATCC MYA-4604 / CBS 118893) TaxID=535722 RepID=E4V2H1_ARTGP|nr:hypothetical protein MGYG_07243 [Nannizzia gypsea CBS 118893]EFR04236.1 hypothetical protein MGYG_07243 [Nannizzia gypsea CBS 118893]